MSDDRTRLGAALSVVSQEELLERRFSTEQLVDTGYGEYLKQRLDGALYLAAYRAAVDPNRCDAGHTGEIRHRTVECRLNSE